MTYEQQVLKGKAQQAARELGHRLGAFRVTNAGSPIRRAYCQAGCLAWVAISPGRQVGEIYGTAIRQKCATGETA